VRPYGDRAVLVDTEHPAALAAQLRGRVGVVDAVPGATSVLVVCADADVARSLELPEVMPTDPASGPVVVIPVQYDGADLEPLAERLGLSIDDIVAMHSTGRYQVAFMGFNAGFAYLSGVDPRLHVPRLDSPRAAVPAGSVAIAAGWTAVYPRRSPGGWHLLGHTDVPMFDLDRQPPALLRPGTTVRFEPDR
jgi:KipI family sensor histidine kinase inhibitor